MTCHRGILQARRHAVLVNEIEECAPTVSAPYLDAAIARCKLPIRVGYRNCPEPFEIWAPHPHCEFGQIQFVETAAEATRVYLDLCESLFTPGASLPASGSDGCSRPSAPEGTF